MNEGKLRRRIKEMFLDINPNISDSRKIELLNLIDEIEKEFEKLISGTWNVDEEGFHLDVYAKDSWLIPSEAIKWFRKWFGDH